jgi:phosphatidylglycerol:prolipoprotein diacylglycerol transferase
MLPYISLGQFLIHTPGLALLIGVWLGSGLVEKEASRMNLKAEVLYKLIFYSLIGGLIGARLVYAAQFVESYVDDLLSLLSPNPNTLSPLGGLAIGLVVAFLLGRNNALPLRPTLDALAPGLALFLVSLGISHILNGDAFGAPTDLPWAIYLWDAYRHPTQVYESLVALAIFLFIWRSSVIRPGTGNRFLLTVALSALARLFLEAFRGDSLTWMGGVRVAQVISLILLIVSLWMMRVWEIEKSNT